MQKLLKYGPITLCILTVFAIVFSARASCSNREWIPFLGKWTGGFTVGSMPSPHASEQSKKLASLYGYVMIYGMGQSFKMHLEGPQEIIDLDGRWSQQGRRLTLTTTGIKIDDEGGAASRDPKLPFIPSDDIHAAYGRRLVLDLSADHRRLSGLSMSIGDLVGRHEFMRD